MASNKVKQIIDSREISVYRFIADTGVSDTLCYALYNNPFKLPSTAIVVRICSAYNLTPNDVIAVS